ncbi:MAG: hypothetical protein Tsb006_3580 [Rickettsiaceae bacterium]
MTKGKQIVTPDFCVIGAGSGGLSFAAGAVQMGASVVLLEAKKMGGSFYTEKIFSPFMKMMVRFIMRWFR